MKLIFCDECWDVFKLKTGKTRQCDCGKCVGKYNEDGHTAVTNGKGICLAIDNNSLVAKLREFAKVDNPTTDYEMLYQGMRIAMWIRPHEGKGNPRSKVDPELLNSKGQGE